MQKRTRLAIVLLVGIALFLLGVWIFLSPLMQARQAAQPPGLPENANGLESETPTRPREAPVPPMPAPEAKPTAESGMLALQNRARSLTERMGTGTADNGFLGYQDIVIDATANGRLALAAARKAMQVAHPPGTPYGQTAKAVTAKTESGGFGQATISILMDVYVAENAGVPGQVTATSPHQVTMTFAKQVDGAYLIDGFTWK